MPGPARPRWLGGWSDRRVLVHDASMQPTLLPGDRLEIDRDAYVDRAPRVGEIVVLRDPEAPERWLVKRVGAVGPAPAGPAGVPVPAGQLFVVSDLAGPTRDSHRFGPVPFAAVVGRAVRIYRPRARARDL